MNIHAMIQANREDVKAKLFAEIHQLVKDKFGLDYGYLAKIARATGIDYNSLKALFGRGTYGFSTTRLRQILDALSTDQSV